MDSDIKLLNTEELIFEKMLLEKGSEIQDRKRYIDILTELFHRLPKFYFRKWYFFKKINPNATVADWEAWRQYCWTLDSYCDHPVTIE